MILLNRSVINHGVSSLKRSSQKEGAGIKPRPGRSEKESEYYPAPSVLLTKTLTKILNCQFITKK